MPGGRFFSCIDEFFECRLALQRGADGARRSALGVIAEGKVSSQDATVIVQDVSVTGADALLRRVLLSLRSADASVMDAELSLRAQERRCSFRTSW